MVDEQQGYSNYDQSTMYDPYFMNRGQDNRIGLIKELSPRVHLINAIHELRGNIIDPESGKIDDKLKILAMMNEEGIKVFYNAVTAAANDINTNSNYRTDDKLIYRLMLKIITDIIYEFYYNRKLYGISEESHCSIIINKAVGLMLPSYFKALGAGDRGAATRSVTEMIQRAFKDPHQDEPQPVRRGIMSRMFPGGKR